MYSVFHYNMTLFWIFFLFAFLLTRLRPSFPSPTPPQPAASHPWDHRHPHLWLPVGSLWFFLFLFSFFLIFFCCCGDAGRRHIYSINEPIGQWYQYGIYRDTFFEKKGCFIVAKKTKKCNGKFSIIKRMAQKDLKNASLKKKRKNYVLLIINRFFWFYCNYGFNLQTTSALRRVYY